jgi:quinol monooxygenase YgiN
VHCASIVLNIAADKAEEFERGFSAHELPTHKDLYERGLLIYSSLSRVTDISTNRVKGAVQYLVIAVFKSHEGHTAHDNDPRFKAWNDMADAYQVQQPFVFGGNSVFTTGP